MGIRVQRQYYDSDCGVASIATYLGQPYERVLTTVRQVNSKAVQPGRGMTITEIIAAAYRLGYELERVTDFNPDEDCGIVSIRGDDGWWHFAVLAYGLLFDTNGWVRPWDEYLERHADASVRFCSLTRVAG